MPWSTSGRTSLANPRSATGRRPSSQYGKENCVQIKDPRPLSDRGYQHKMSGYVIEFLTESNYPHEISMRILSAPSMKEFCNIFQFLYNYMKGESHGVRGFRKPTEEIPKVFKTMGYPFSISKSNLHSVGSPHAWPIILGALCWLIELIKHAMSVSENILGNVLFPEDTYETGQYQDDGPKPEDKYFFSYLEKSYAAFLMGRELDELGEYDNEFIENIRLRKADAPDGMKEIMKEKLSLEEELNALKSDSSRLQRLSDRKATLVSDREKFVNYIGDLRKHKKQLADVNSQQMEELQVLKVEQDAAVEENSKLQETLNNQELSAADVTRMKLEKKELQKAVEELGKSRDYFDQQIWEKEMQYAKKYEETEKHIQEYNKMARKLKLIPSRAEHANGIDFEMHFNPHTHRPDQRTHVDFKGTIKPALLRLKQQMSEKIRTVQSQIITEEEAVDQLSDMVLEKKEEVTALDMRLQALDKDLDWKKEIMAKQYQKSTGNAQSLEEGVQQMRSELREKEEEVEELEKKLKEHKLRAEESRIAREQEKEEYSNFILEACQMIKEHKTAIHNRIQELRENAKDILEETKALEVSKSSILSAPQKMEDQSVEGRLAK